MHVNFEVRNSILVAFLNGELDHHSAEEVRTKMDDRLDRENSEGLIMDFSGVTFMDSSGIGVVIGRYRKMDSKGKKICIINAKDRVNKIFDISGVYKLITHYDSLDDAICSL